MSSKYLSSSFVLCHTTFGDDLVIGQEAGPWLLGANKRGFQQRLLLRHSNVPRVTKLGSIVVMKRYISLCSFVWVYIEV